MTDWGRNRSGNYYHQGGVPRPQQQQQPYRHPNRKPPPHENWHPTVPLWEKNFCTKVCRIPWGRIVEAQKVMHIYKSVIQWDDLAGEEAFHNAKTRYWAEINNRACDISFPDPDMYIDEVDWDAEIDPELLLDLERAPEVPEVDEFDKKPGLVADTLYQLNQPVVCSGWGDPDDEPVRTDNNHCEKNTSNNDNPWESSYGGRDKNASNQNNPWMEGHEDEKANPWEKGCFNGKPHLTSNAWGGDSWNLEPLQNTNNNMNPHWQNSANNQWENHIDSQWGNKPNEWENPNSRRSNENWRKRESEGHGWRNGGGRKRVSFTGVGRSNALRC